MHKTLSIKDAFQFGWEEWKKRWLFWASFFLVIFAISLIPALLGMALPEDAYLASFFISAIQWILEIIISLGITTVTLKAAYQQNYDFTDFFSKINLLPSYLWSYLLYALVVTVGMLLLIIPGIIFLIMFCLCFFFVIDRAETGYDSLMESKKAVYGYKWKIFFFWIAAFFFNLLGLLLLGVGLLLTLPVTMIAFAYIYLKLTEDTV